MIARFAIIFVGVIVAGVFLNLYFLPLAFVTGFLLGIDSPVWRSAQYWLCFVAGVITAYFVMRPVWRSVGAKEKEASNGTQET